LIKRAVKGRAGTGRYLRDKNLIAAQTVE